MPGAEDVTDVGVRSMLPGPRVRRAIGAKGHTFVRHAVVATLLGVTWRASRNASCGNINFGCVAELYAPDINIKGNASLR